MLPNFCINLDFILHYSQGLPTTPYYKLIDWWLFFCTYSLIFTMGFHTYLAHAISKAKDGNSSMQKMITTSQWMYPRKKTSKDMDEKKSMKSVRRLNSAGKAFFAITLVAFNAVFWLIAIREYMKPAEAYLKN